MKRFATFFLLVFLVMGAYAQQAKYIFYFIGDGMGLNQVNGTEMFLAQSKDGTIGVQPLLFPSFPVVSYATSFSQSNSVTDSAAAGTALATGTKTYNGAIGVDPSKNPVESVAIKAKKAGKKVGITTTVSVDHATPSAFYAHQDNRNWYYEIAHDLAKADLDFVGGSGFLKPTTDKNGKSAPDVIPTIKEAGYTIAHGVKDYEAKKAQAKRMILIEREGWTAGSLNYAIDQKDGDLTLSQIVESAINFLDNKKGFFIMAEGGKIDSGGHANDVATTFKEVVDMDNAIKVAYEFYKKHPKETLIVVTADHETGGLSLCANSEYILHLDALKYQTSSIDGLSRKITDLRKAGTTSWEDVKALLSKEMGMWSQYPISWEQEKMLRDSYEDTFVKRNQKFDENMYSRQEALAGVAKKVLAEYAHISWASGSHSAAYVPVYAIGAGSNLFQGKLDNTDIPKKLAQAGGYKW